MKDIVQYKSDKNRWHEYATLTNDQAKKLIDDKLKRAKMLSEALHKLNKQK